MKKTKPDWEYKAVINAVPYVKSLMNSIRDCTIQINGIKSRLKRLADKPGRCDRQRYDEIGDLKLQEIKKQTELDWSQEDLKSLGVLCYDAVQQIAMFYFRMKDGDSFSGAWFVYSIVDKSITWRRDDDEYDVRRKIQDIPKQS